MPFSWTAASEKQMLITVISKANLRPTNETWATVAKELGHGLTPSAVSQKYYKLKNDSVGSGGDSTKSSARATPKKSRLKSSPQTINGTVEECDDSDTIMVTPQRLIADRPHNKIHRDDLEGQNGERAWATPSKKRKFKREQVDGDSDADYVD